MKCVLLSLALLVAVAMPAEAGFRRSRCRTCRPSGNCAVVNGVVESGPAIHHEAVMQEPVAVMPTQESYTSSTVVVAQPKSSPCKDGKCPLRRQ